jgi:hypothetical protein
VNLGEIKALVNEGFYRPEKQNFLPLYINAACRLVANAGRLPGLLEEYTVAPTDANFSTLASNTHYAYSWQLPTVQAKIEYIQHVDTGQTIGLVTPAQLLTHPYEYNVAYQAGSMLKIRVKTQFTLGFNIGLYMPPTELIADTDSNYVTEHFPEFVVDHVLAQLMTMVGRR